MMMTMVVQAAAWFGLVCSRSLCTRAGLYMCFC
ncbi:hypothetical protein CTAM01_13678 [Colletotrichum tamarilloi]|uniref:Uncharacterized protein n=1 Tax=Colletotrichum tamarilloi TaxID=1209934 RepID=A0ABQ9QRT0_9PEZI|nr:uncharacterized protein CTAM01_13678 [Colletotrichum tamarilloi]KAK1482225.1 hypothetical protein CTAM01_13678 [Colletotrichum tamarilloi]